MPPVSLLFLGILFAIPIMLELWWFFVVMKCYRLLKCQQVVHREQYSIPGSLRKIGYTARLVGHFHKRENSTNEMETVLGDKFGVDFEALDKKNKTACEEGPCEASSL